MGYTQDRGAWAERLAAQWLMERGYVLRHTNWRSGRYEMDIVAEKGDTICFVEVKCRRDGGLTTPEQAITPAKFQALQKAAEAYISMYGIDLEPRFDAVLVTFRNENDFHIEHIPDAMITGW